MNPPRSAGGAALFACGLALGLAACHSPTTPSPSPSPSLPPAPVPVSPVGGVELATVDAELVVQNAQGFDAGQATYTFHLRTATGVREIATREVPAGSGTTRTTMTVPRGLQLSWLVSAQGTRGETSSPPASFRAPPMDCLAGRDPYAKSVVDWFIPACSLAENHYNDPNQVLGPPDSEGHGPDSFTGFLSLGFGGWVTVDMEGCAVDGPGPDVRVYQRASSEPVTLWASGSADGPFVLVDYRKECGAPSPGLRSGHCDFDLAGGELEEARYFKIQDGELYPCPGDTVTEGADIDAIEILHEAP